MGNNLCGASGRSQAKDKDKPEGTNHRVSRTKNSEGPRREVNGLGLHQSRALTPAQVKALQEAVGTVKSISPQKTHGVVRFTLLRAVLPESPHKVHATVSIGLQSFLSSTESSDKPEWNEGHHFVLQKDGGGTTAQVSIFSKKNLKANLMCYALVNLKRYFNVELGYLNTSVEQEFPLMDPTHNSKQVGSVWIRVEASTIEHLEETLWERLLRMVDANGDNQMQKDEFKKLMQMLGNEFSEQELDMMYAKADSNSDGDVTGTELAKYITKVRKEFGLKFLRQCPVTGSDLAEGSDYANIVYIHLAMDNGTGESLQGGYKTADEASRSWMFKLSEWVTHPLGGSFDQFYTGNKYEAGGLNVGTMASHILVWDREKGLVFEEKISPHLVLAMRNLYQSPIGKGMMATGAPQVALKELSESKGEYMDSPESVKDIPRFLGSFAGNINMDDALEPIGGYRTFNEFFYRKLKPEARPIAEKGDSAIAVCAADCRLMVFKSVDESTRLWIKGKHFSIKGLLADNSGGVSKKYESGSLAVFRLAPQVRMGTGHHRRANADVWIQVVTFILLFCLLILSHQAAPRMRSPLEIKTGLPARNQDVSPGKGVTRRTALVLDYHRFHFPVSGVLRKITSVPGQLYTVNPIAVNSSFNVFTENKRSLCFIETQEYGEVAFVCIGATMVGSIVLTAQEGQRYEKGDEMGYFAFGGSTTIALFQEGSIEFDSDLLEHSGRSLETLVKMGTRLGQSCRSG